MSRMIRIKRSAAVMLINVLIASSMLPGCGKVKETSSNDVDDKDVQVETQQETNSDIKTTEVDKTLIFRDVFGKEYETKIVSSIAPAQYDKEKFVTTDGKMNYTGTGYSQRLGIDVSTYQGNVDWEKVKNAGYEFVIIRIGFRGYGDAGTLCLDDKFYEYYEGAEAAGLDIGCYFFAQAVNEEEAKEEASFVTNALKAKNITLELPVVYDPEHILDDDARTDNVTGEQFTKNTIAFCNAMEAEGYTCMVYSNMLWEAFQYDLTQLTKYPIWYADYEPLPQTPYHFEYWQYTQTGSVPGIAGEVDIDIQLSKTP